MSTPVEMTAHDTADHIDDHVACVTGLAQCWAGVDIRVTWHQGHEAAALDALTRVYERVTDALRKAVVT